MTPVLTGIVIDKVLIQHRPGLLHEVIALIVCTTAAYLGANFLRAYVLLRVKVRLALAMHQDLLCKLHRLSFTYTSQRQAGYLASRILDDPSTACEFMTGELLTVLQNAITFVVAFSTMLWLSWRLALLSVLVIPLYSIIGNHFTTRLRDLSVKAAETTAQMSRSLLETIAGTYTINICRAERESSRRFFAQQKETARAQVAQVKVGLKVSFIRSVIASAGPILILWYGGLAVIHGSMSIGQLVAFSGVFGYVFNAAQSLTATQISLPRVAVAIDRIMEILDVHDDVMPDSRSIGRMHSARSAEFEHVQFRYDEHRIILRDITMTIPAGEITALVGKSGEGKSTIAHLLMGLYRPCQGVIRVDHVDLQRVEHQKLRSLIALVPQEIFLFSMSIEDNIRLGCKTASHADVVEAARRAHIHDFISELPAGYNTIVGENGSTLSGGQRQRVGIARALLRRPQLLILDEAESEIDGVAERAICGAIRDLNQTYGTTVLLIAHRSTTVREAEMIHVLEGGLVIGSGSHGSLLATCPTYRSLFQFQCDPDISEPVCAIKEHV
jgi:ABC-type bacteriocin/lantibiotic exporter with double-glycine peptidase domain